MDIWLDGPCLWPWRATLWLGGESFTWDMDILRHRPNPLYGPDITLLLLQIFRVSDTGLEKLIEEVKYEAAKGNHSE